MTTLRRITALMLWLSGAQSVDWTIVRAIYTQPGSWGAPTRQYDVQPMLSSLIHPGIRTIIFTVNDGLITGRPSHTGRRACTLWSAPAQLQVIVRCGDATSTHRFTQGESAILQCPVVVHQPNTEILAISRKVDGLRLIIKEFREELVRFHLNLAPSSKADVERPTHQE